jgi:predicted DNA-binding transcriptional regulator YafY
VGDLRSLAEELLAARVVEPEVPTSGPAAGVRQHGDHLSNRELTLLTDALEAEKPIQITYLDQNDRISSRKVTPLAVMGGLMEAWCHLREDERHFLISRIRGVDTPR